eukprot:9476641-Pyramimonas_sp.AAC.1
MVCRTIAGYQQQRCSRFPEAFTLVRLDARSGTREISTPRGCQTGLLTAVGAHKVHAKSLRRNRHRARAPIVGRSRSLQQVYGPSTLINNDQQLRLSGVLSASLPLLA